MQKLNFSPENTEKTDSSSSNSESYFNQEKKLQNCTKIKEKNSDLNLNKKSPKNKLEKFNELKKENHKAICKHTDIIDKNSKIKSLKSTVSDNKINENEKKKIKKSPIKKIK